MHRCPGAYSIQSSSPFIPYAHYIYNAHKEASKRGGTMTFRLSTVISNIKVPHSFFKAQQCVLDGVLSGKVSKEQTSLNRIAYIFMGYVNVQF